jgi:hypothetical protein
VAIWNAEAVKRWLAEQGFEQLSDGSWRASEGDELATDELAGDAAELALEASELSLRERLDLGLGLLDLLDSYGVTMYLRFELLGGGSLSAFVPEVWDYYRKALEQDDEPSAVAYSLWVDWFEDRSTAPIWFSEMVRGYEAASSSNPPAALINRLRHILKNSGPVPWAAKSAVLFSLVPVTSLQSAVFEALLHGYHDFYGDLDRAEGLELLELLDAQDTNPRFNALRGALNAGVTNHYTQPDQWPQGL